MFDTVEVSDFHIWIKSLQSKIVIETLGIKMNSNHYC